MLCLNTQKESGRQICPDSLSFTKMGSDNWTQETLADQPLVTVLVVTENIKYLMVELQCLFSDQPGRCPQQTPYALLPTVFYQGILSSIHFPFFKIFYNCAY